MPKASILLTGGSGVLGTELQKYIECYAPSHADFDILDVDGNLAKLNVKQYDIVIHSAAYTDVPGAEIEKKKCFDINVKGTLRLLQAFPSAFFVYISSEYANKPMNYYSWTKLWGEEMVEKSLSPYLIVRTLFKPNPFPYEYAFFDQYTTGDYVDVIAPMIVKEIMKGSKKDNGLHRREMISLGTGRKTMFELARRTKPNIKAITIDDVKGVVLPKDYK